MDTTFFDQLPIVMKQVPLLPGEEALYKWIGRVLDAAAKDSTVMKTLRETAFAADKELIAPMMWWRFNGGPARPGALLLSEPAGTLCAGDEEQVAEGQRRWQPDGLPVYLGNRSPGQEGESNWIPSPAGSFSIWLHGGPGVSFRFSVGFAPYVPGEISDPVVISLSK